MTKDNQFKRHSPQEVSNDADKSMNEIIPQFAPNQLNAAAPLFRPKPRTTPQQEIIRNGMQSVPTDRVIHHENHVEADDPSDIQERQSFHVQLSEPQPFQELSEFNGETIPRQEPPQ